MQKKPEEKSYPMVANAGTSFNRGRRNVFTKGAVPLLKLPQISTKNSILHHMHQLNVLKKPEEQQYPMAANAGTTFNKN